MPSRALIVAIENYPDAEDVARTLPGTVDGGNHFLDWLITTKKVNPRHILYCADRDVPGRTADTTRAAITESLSELVAGGKETGTEELYVFFAGHGFGFRTSPKSRPTDVLV